MAAKKDFDIGDLVWAKMKGFPFWPAKIVEPPTDAKSAPKKSRHYVFFFGSENYAWIQDENIVYHSDEMLQSTSNKKKKSTLLKVAVQNIIKEASQKAKSLIKEEKYPVASTSGTQKKTAKVQRRKGGNEIPAVPKKVVPNRDSINSPVNKRKTTARTSSKTTRPVQEGPSTSKAKKPIKKIGFIGLGMMGQRLVKHLLRSKHNVTVWNRTFNKCSDFARIGAAVAQTPRALVRKCDIIFCCVSDPDASKSVVFRSDGILSGLERSTPGSKGYVELSTMDPTNSILIGAAVNQKGGRYLEAPINGSLKMAENRTVTVFCAGDIELFRNCESCFQAFGQHALHLNCEVGPGSTINIIHGMLNSMSYAALAEAMALVRNCNLSVITFLEILKKLSLDSEFIRENGLTLLSHSLQCKNSLKYQQKSLQLALSLVPDCDHPMLLTAAANELYRLALFRHCPNLTFFYLNR